MVSVPTPVPLSTRRFFALLQQMVADPKLPEVRTEHGACVYLKIDPTYPLQLRKREGAEVGLDVIGRVQRKLGLRREFFFAETPTDPSYRDFLESSTVRDDELGHPIVEAFIARKTRDGDPPSPTHANELRSLRRSMGPDSITDEVLEGFLRGLRARDANRALERPLVPSAVESERGQRPLPSSRKRG